jgi:hypothetical protein
MPSGQLSYSLGVILWVEIRIRLVVIDDVVLAVNAPVLDLRAVQMTLD